MCVHVWERERQTDRQRERETERETDGEREGRLRLNFPPLTTFLYVSDQKEMKTTLQSSRLPTQGWRPLRKWCTHSQVPQDEVALLCINTYFLLGDFFSSFHYIQPGVKHTPMGKIQCAIAQVNAYGEDTMCNSPSPRLWGRYNVQCTKLAIQTSPQNTMCNVLNLRSRPNPKIQSGMY